MNTKTVIGCFARSSYRFLMLLLIADLGFVIMYALYGFKFVTDPRFGLIEDRSYGEMFQYIKEIWIVVLLALFAVERRTWRYVLWAGVFFYLLLDDSCRFHETAGGWLVQWLDLPAILTLHAQDVGEILYIGTVGGGLLVSIMLSFIKAPIDYRWTASRLLFLLFALAFFGVFVDMVRIEGHWMIDKAMGAFEDGGEQVVMSFIVWFTYGLSPPEASESQAASRDVARSTVSLSAESPDR